MIEVGAIHILKNCKGCFFVRNDKEAVKKGWASGVVSDVSGDETKVVIYLAPMDRWDKKPPIEVPLSLIVSAHRDSERRLTTIHTYSQDITIQQEA